MQISSEKFNEKPSVWKKERISKPATAALVTQNSSASSLDKNVL